MKLISLTSWQNINSDVISWILAFDVRNFNHGDFNEWKYYTETALMKPNIGQYYSY